MINIGLVPCVTEKYRNQFEYSVDIRWYKFLNKAFKKPNIEILSKNFKNKKINLIILTGGNNLKSFSKRKIDEVRANLDKFYLDISVKKKIPLVGICYGAQFIAKYFNNKIYKTKKHVGAHKLKIINSSFNKEKKIFKVNSYHDYCIKNLNKKFETIGLAPDKTIEFFKIKKLKLYGIMWHPERNIFLKDLDLHIFKKICS